MKDYCNVNHNYFLNKAMQLEKLSCDEMKLLHKAVKYYLDHNSSYRKTMLKFNVRSDYFAILLHMIELSKGITKLCPFCDKGNYRKTYCNFCLGLGTINKKMHKQFHDIKWINTLEKRGKMK